LQDVEEMAAALTKRAELERDPVKSHETMLQLIQLLHDHADFMRVMTYHMFRELLQPHH